MNRRALKLASFVLFLSIFCGCKGGKAQTTINAASCNETDVQAAVALATTDGDVVSIPAGNCLWSTPYIVTLANSITIQGAGAQVPSASCTFAPGTSCTTTDGSDQTILVDNINRSVNDSPMWQLTTIPGKTLRMTGIALYFTTNTTQSFKGSLRIQGTSQAIRLDHWHFFGKQNHWVAIFGWIYGVADHNQFDFQAGDANGIAVSNAAFYNNDPAIQGDMSWADDSHFGSGNFFFIEDNAFTSTTLPIETSVNDCDHGGREVIRYNTLGSGVVVQTHEMENNVRGCRATEIYGNTATTTGGAFAYLAFLRMGANLIWGNTTTGIKRVVNFNDDRTNTVNGTQNGWGHCGQGISGTVNTNGTAVTWVSGQQFVSTGDITGPGWPDAATPNIVINGVSYPIALTQSGTSLTLASSAGTQTAVPFYAPSLWDQNTDSTGYACLDQLGRGKSDLLTGLFPNKVNSVTGTVSWPRNQLDPIYIWDNTYHSIADNTAAITGTNSVTVADSRDFYLDGQTALTQTSTTSPFNGANVVETISSWTITGGSPTGTLTLTVPATTGLSAGQYVNAVNTSPGTSHGSNINNTYVISSVTPTTVSMPYSSSFNDSNPTGGGWVSTPGVGFGTQANMPTTCTPVVTYWATDANNGNGQLYQCTATNTWTAFYTPFTYPHPLTTNGVPNPPSALGVLIEK